MTYMSRICCQTAKNDSTVISYPREEMKGNEINGVLCHLCAQSCAIYRRHRIGRNVHFDQMDAVDIVTAKIIRAALINLLY